MAEDVLIREYRAGDPSLVSHLQMMLYREQYGFKDIFEYYLTKGISDFLLDPIGSQLWVAEQNGKVVASIAVVKTGDISAQLRWFAVDSSLQGMGIGNKLVDIAMQFCLEQGYVNVALWTIDILHAARHLYKKHGFSIVETKENTEWTDDVLLEEKWEYHL